MVITRVRRTIEEHALIDSMQHIVLGLSGGPDSVCLFHVLLRLQKELRFSIHPVHVNHRFRPGDAERDQAYVETLCRGKGLSCRSFSVDCGKLAKQLDMTPEEAGRKARYDAFYQVASDVAAQLAEGRHPPGKDRVSIAVAQNADDQAETILFRLLRGTGTDGLAGIAYKREERGFPVIRPLLDVPRSEIEAYCSSNGLHPVTDYTNHQTLYARNKIRLELIPYLEKGYNGNVKESLVRLGRIAAADKEYLWQQAEDAYEKLAMRDAETGSIAMDRRELSGLHRAVRHRVIRKAFGLLGLQQDISEERIAAADFIIEKKQAPKTVEFPQGYRLTVARGQVVFAKDPCDSAL